MAMPSWHDFEDRPVQAVEVVAPAIELASVLRRYREDVDAAARAGMEGRTQGLRALAEQAVLATELEQLLARQPAGDAMSALRDTLSRLTDRMLEGIRAAGLEIVPLVGLEANAAIALADVEAWQYDDALTDEIVLEQIEAAVLHHGVTLRRGRVVMGAPRRGGAASDGAVRERRPDIPAERFRPVEPSAGGEHIVCPVVDCATENAPDAEVCVGCLTHLGGYARLSKLPRLLFNRGLRAARTGDSRAARDCFAAVVLWHPDDLESRNAYALACLESQDRKAATDAWEAVLAQAPADPIAIAGLGVLRRDSRPAVAD